jgi:SAM-dependent methyltransferase
MLEKARPFETAGLRFELGDIAGFDAPSEFDVVFSNAALHWVPDHPSLLRRLRDALRPGGQLAVQVPANGDHPSHALPFEIAHEAPFRDALHDDPLGDQATPVLARGVRHAARRARLRRPARSAPGLRPPPGVDRRRRRMDEGDDAHALRARSVGRAVRAVRRPLSPPTTRRARRPVPLLLYVQARAVPRPTGLKRNATG